MYDRILPLLLLALATGCSGKVTTTSGGQGGGPPGAPMNPDEPDDAGGPPPIYDASVPTEDADATSSTPDDVSAPPPTTDACGTSTLDASNPTLTLGTACNPYWWATTTCADGLRCCRAVGAPPYVMDAEGGLETPGYTCESLSDTRFVCIGPTQNQPCDPNTASNDPLDCAWSVACQPALSCCYTSQDPTYQCRSLDGEAGVTYTCVL